MKLLFVVQRYGSEVAGGAEAFARAFATRLVGRGHHVTVLTSAALSYVDWADHYPIGSSVLEGVDLERLGVREARSDRFFGPLHARMMTGSRPVPLHLQKEWMRIQGPWLDGLEQWLQAEAGGFDVAVFFTYLYQTTFAGLPIASGQVPTVLHPTAHDEPPIYLPIFDFLFRYPTAFGFLTEEESALVRERFGVRRPSITTGIGVDLEARGVAQRFRDKHGLGDAPYLLYVGRLDPHKGSVELAEYFAAYKERHPSALKLVLVGEPVRPVGLHPDLVPTGFVSEEEKLDAIAGCLALVHPSYFESFSMVLTEAWAASRPALVQGHCAVLVGQAKRSGGALYYRGFAEFEAAVDLIVEDDDLRQALGSAGRAYVEERYDWSSILRRYEQFLERLPRRVLGHNAARR